FCAWQASLVHKIEQCIFLRCLIYNMYGGVIQMMLIQPFFRFLTRSAFSIPIKRYYHCFLPFLFSILSCFLLISMKSMSRVQNNRIARFLFETEWLKYKS